MNDHKEQISYEPKGTGSDDRNGGCPVDTARAYNLHPDSQWYPSPPRRDFEIAIICALPLEASVVGALFDRRYDDKTYGKALGDPNAYSTGVIGHHNVVLVHMPNMVSCSPRPQPPPFVLALRRSSLLWWSAFAAVHHSGRNWVKTSSSVTLLLAKVSFSTILGGISLIIDLCGRIRLGITYQGQAIRSVRPWPSCKPNRVEAGSRIRRLNISCIATGIER